MIHKKLFFLHFVLAMTNIKCTFVHIRTHKYTHKRERETDRQKERNLFVLLSSYTSEFNIGIDQTTNKDTPMSGLSQCNCKE